MINYILNYFKKDILKEGKVSFLKGKNSFYNPVQVFNRDISLLFINNYAKNKNKKINILDGFSGTGFFNKNKIIKNE